MRRQSECTIFLDLPKECERIFREISAGLPFELVIERLQEEGIYKMPEDTQHYRLTRDITSSGDTLSPFKIAFLTFFHFKPYLGELVVE